MSSSKEKDEYRDLDPAMAEFERKLDNKPDDWDLRLAYAELLESLGHFILAGGQRWQARNQKKPSDGKDHCDGGTFSWYSKDLPYRGTSANIPDSALEYMKAHPICSSRYFGGRTRRQAEVGLAVALACIGVLDNERRAATTGHEAPVREVP